jgi:SAM-dependent methyltransferase
LLLGWKVKDLLLAMPTTPNFDQLARPYRWLEYLTFGPILQQTRTHFLPELTQSRHALVLGDGDGRFTRALLRANPQIQIHAIDLSAAMLRALQRSAHPHQNRLTTEVADLRHWIPASSVQYDLIATHFFLDCLTTEEIASLATRLTPHTTPNGLWIVSDFQIPPTPFGHWIAEPLISLLYKAFDLLTHLHVRHLPNHPSALQNANWALKSHHPRLKGLLISQLWQKSSSQAPSTN